MLVLLLSLAIGTLSTRPEFVCINRNTKNLTYEYTDLSSNELECYSRRFTATTDFQEIRQGQELTEGLHIRFDVQSQKREAKLILDAELENKILPQEVILVEDDTESNGTQNLSTNIDDIMVKIQQMNHENATPERQEERIQNYYERQAKRLTDNEMIQHCIEKLTNSRDLQEISALLDQIKDNDLVDDVNNGIHFMKLMPCPTITKIASLESTDLAEEIKQKFYIVLGSAVQNNEDAKNELKCDIVQLLIESLKGTRNEKTVHRLLFCLISLVNNSEEFIKQFKELNGNKVLLDVYLRNRNERCIDIMKAINPKIAEDETDLIKIFNV